MSNRIDRWLNVLESRLSLVLMLGGASVIGFLSALAARATSWMNEYGPISWVAAGILGALLASIVFAVASSARLRWIRAHYNAQLIKRSGFVDPLATTFHNKRIHLSDFVEPANSFIEGKTFVDCDIVGPAIIYLESFNHLNQTRYPVSDVVLLEPGKPVFNAVLVRNCVFRRCAFVKVTFLIPKSDFDTFKSLTTLNWISPTHETVQPVDTSERPDLRPIEVSEVVGKDEEAPQEGD